MISKIYATEVYPIPTCDVIKQLSESLKLLPTHESFIRSLFPSTEFIFEI
jgi:hypothetical protein